MLKPKRYGGGGMKEKIDDLAWKAFEKSGDAGMYLFYKALKEEQKDEKA